MSTFYTDRAKVSVGGTDMSNIVQVGYTEDAQVSPVDVMTPDHSIGGWVRGNSRFTVSITESITTRDGLIPFSQLDYELVNVAIVINSASGSYAPPGGGGVPYSGPAVVLTGTAFLGQDWDYPGPGQPARRTLRFGAAYAAES